MSTYSAKVYKLTNTVNAKFYIGSTKQRLSNRMASHRSLARKNIKQGPIYVEMRTTGIDTWHITLIESRDVPDKEHQLKFEREVQDRFMSDRNCLNHLRAYLSPDERKEVKKRCTEDWRDRNSERVKERRRQYKQENADRIRERTRQYKTSGRFRCVVCDHNFNSNSHLLAHCGSKRHNKNETLFYLQHLPFGYAVPAAAQSEN